ncbi:MAG: hypothetical protein ACLQVI_42685 [Polyangiaceae bacterium]
MWFAENEGLNAVGRITMSGVATSFPVGSGGETNTSAVAIGPNGTVWFAETNSGKVGRIEVCAGGRER